MNPVKILIVEDEAIIAMDLQMRLEKDGYDVVGVVDNNEEAVEVFHTTKPDIVLMDINIGGKDGIETAVALMQIKIIPVIFLTAFGQPEFVDRAKQIKPSAYLVKPYNYDSLRTSIEVALHNFASAVDNKTLIEKGREPILQFSNTFFIKQNYRFVKVEMDELLYVESDNNYISLHTRDQKFVLKLSLNYLAERLQLSFLVRVHRSYMVNLGKIDAFTDDEIRVGTHVIPLGRNYKEQFLKSFNFL